MDRFKQRLTKGDSKISVNEELNQPINLESKVKVIPLTDVNRTLNVNDQFNKERQASGIYRLIVTTITLLNNVLFDLSTWDTLNVLKDTSIAPSGIVTFEESIEQNINVRGGWYGNLNKINLTNTDGAVFTQFSPKADKFSILPERVGTTLTDNWKVKITYPKTIDDSHYVVVNGLIIIKKFLSIVGGRDMLGLTTPVKHGLKQGEFVTISGLNAGYTNKMYRVVKIGDNKGEEDGVEEKVVNQKVKVKEVEEVKEEKDYSEVGSTFTNETGTEYTKVK